MSINVGEVVAVRGTQVTLRIFDESNLETIYYDGRKYKGVSIREYLAIKRGFYLIVCFVEGEYLDENKFVEENDKKSYIRKVDVKPIGYFDENKFYDGIKIMPMIKDLAFLLSEKQIEQIFPKDTTSAFKIGKMLKEDIPISLPWVNVFNSHIGIFGNTGSGKSNTLTKLYTEIFNKFSNKMGGKSEFVLIDFNGEYTGNQLVNEEHKKVFKLTTIEEEDKRDKFPLSEEQFWDTEMLALLFKATANTQTPFLNRVVTGREKFKENADSLKKYIKSVFKECFEVGSQHPYSLPYLKKLAKFYKEDVKTEDVKTEDDDNKLVKILNSISWHSKSNCFYLNNEYFNKPSAYDDILEGLVNKIQITYINSFDELVIRINLQLLRDLNRNFVQYDHISPLLKRVESAKDFNKVFDIIKSDDSTAEKKLLTVISLRNCNQDMKKIVPLLLTKMYYHNHKEGATSPPSKTLHLIIDEAHNILSQQSSREHETWKDYRLELFEEIIKEGRKFGVYLTLSSQRPADISQTIMSQVNNFFIHRLVNDKDLALLDNSISTLDRFSKSLIPNLSKGSCIVTGAAFDIPMTIQVDYIENKEHRPHSDDVDLEVLWK